MESSQEHNSTTGTPAGTSTGPKPDYLKTIYEENGRQNRFLVDWRHKILVRFFVAVASLLLVAKWIGDKMECYVTFWQWIPFSMITIISLAFYIMDKRDIVFMDMCARVGADLEKNMGYAQGFYQTYLATHLRKNNSIKRPFIAFTTALKIIYLGTALLSFVITLLALFS